MGPVMSDHSVEADPETETVEPVTNDLAGTEPAPPEDESPFRSLRIWPAFFIVVLLWCLRIIPPMMAEEPSIALMMAAYMGPMVLSGMLVFIWWPFFSRASLKEKLIGFFGVLAIMGVTTAVADETVQSLGMMLYGIPWGTSAFAIGACVFGFQKSMKRTWVALLAALIGFGYWDLVRIDDIRGDFATTFSWRWEPSPEAETLKQIANRKQADVKEPIENGNEAEQLPAPEWSEFRGPNRDGIQPGVAIAEDWEKKPLRELWRIPVGPAWSSFSVAGDLIYTQEQRDDKEAIVCFDANTGDTVWSHEYDSRFWEVIGGPGPRATPTLVGKRLYAMGANGLLTCLNRFTGEEIWQTDIRQEANRKPPTWGFASSPLVTHGVVIVHAGGKEDKGVLAYDTETGKFKWGTLTGDDTYSSPQLNTFDGKDYVLMLTNTGLSVIDPKEGNLLVDHAFPFEGYRVVQPLVFDKNSILLGSPMGGGTQRVSLHSAKGLVSVAESWTTKRMNPYFNDYVFHKDHLYGFDNAIFACIELKEGNRKWKRGRYGHGQVLLLPEEDQLLILSEDGELVMLRATPDAHEELTRTQVLDSRTWNHPVVVDDKLYVRNAEEAACFKVPLLTSSEKAVDPTDLPD